jgi:osmotically-inducible protein OsmY
LADQSTEPDLYLAERVREALARDPRVAELGVEVEIRGQTIVFRGTMTSPEQQVAAVAIARDILPAYRVRDVTMVADLTEPTDSEHLP